jgi:hypothetical protein
MNKEIPITPDEVIMNKIYMIRSKKVMIDRDLAELYGVETRVLNQAVKRNPDRFPDDFMFRMTNDEMENWKSQFVISNREKMGLRKPPLAFTEQGLAMLSSVLNSEKAILVNIQIIRIFTKMREMLLTHKDLLIKMNELESKFSNQDKSIKQIFAYLKQLVKEQESPRQAIGFKHQGTN